jgi:hypothetical protein
VKQESRTPVPKCLLGTEIRPNRAEGERFELSRDVTAPNGFRDRRIRPLCHPSGTSRVAEDPLDLSTGRDAKLDTGGSYPVSSGEVAEWLKAAPC